MDILQVLGASFVVGIIIFVVQEYRMDMRIREERLRRRLDAEIKKHKEEYLDKPLSERVDESNDRLDRESVRKHLGRSQGED